MDLGKGTAGTQPSGGRFRAVDTNAVIEAIIG